MESGPFEQALRDLGVNFRDAHGDPLPLGPMLRELERAFDRMGQPSTQEPRWALVGLFGHPEPPLFWDDEE